MALNTILGGALAGLQAAQIGLRTASNNIANVNTPGYARAEVIQVAGGDSGASVAVEVRGVRRVADQFLAAASLRAASDAQGAATIAEFLDRLQAQIGAPGEETSLFGRLDQAAASLATAATDPAQNAPRQAALFDLQSVFDETRRLSSEVRSLREEADRRLASGVARVNEILSEIETLNGQARSLNVTGADVTGTENRRSELVDELAGLIDIRTEIQRDGRLFIRTQDGVSLLDNEVAQITYRTAGSGAYGIDYDPVTVTVSSSGATAEIGANFKSGELRALIDARDEELPRLAAVLAELSAGAADAINAASNNATAVPPPNTLEGRNTGRLGGDLLGGSGAASLAVVASDGTLVQRVDLAFNPGGFTVKGAAGTTINDLVAGLNGAFGGTATATFANGLLSIAATNPATGLAAVQDEAAPSSIGGRGFSQFFGLNDLIDNAQTGFYETGLTGGEALGLNPGGQIGFKVKTPDGRTAADIDIPVSGTTINGYLAAINDPATGIGAFGSYALNAQGALEFTPAPGYEGYAIDPVRDNTQRGTTGLSFSQIFGLGEGVRLSRAEGFNVRPAVRNDAGRLPLSQLDLSAAPAPGDFVLDAGDTRGGQALQNAFETPRRFPAAGALAAGGFSVSAYAARFAGEAGARAAQAERLQEGAEAVQAAADQKRADVEGVNLDEELANVAQLQTAYNASARLIQTAQELTDTLLSLV